MVNGKNALFCVRGISDRDEQILPGIEARLEKMTKW
jgi:hypothetical protein